MEQAELSLKSQVEALVFASPEPLNVHDILQVLDDDAYTASGIEALLEELRRDYAAPTRGFCLHCDENDRYSFRTQASASGLMERLFRRKARPLSRAALETLAIIAYRQPATRAEIEFIRGVDAGSIVKNLLERELIQCLGRRNEIGRPMEFGTTTEFLQTFGLSSLADLPSLHSFQIPAELLEQAEEKLERFAVQPSLEDFVGQPD